MEIRNLSTLHIKPTLIMTNTISLSTKIGAAITALAIFFVGSALSAQAAHLDWDTTGDYDIAFEYNGDVYTHDLTLVQATDGSLTGEGGFPAGGTHTYHWVLTSGSVLADDSINFTANYTIGSGTQDPLTTMVVTGMIEANGTLSGTWSDNYGGGARTGSFETTAGMAEEINNYALAAEDFGVMDQSGVKGYTAGFGLTNATLADIDTVVVKLYSGATLLQTNTGTAQINTLSGMQFSSPFDVYGTFNYTTDGYWVNVREAEYGQNLIPTRVVATVTLDDGTVLTAENTTLTGDPASIKPVTPPPTVSAKDKCKNGGWKTMTNPTFKNQGQCVAFVNHNN